MSTEDSIELIYKDKLLKLLTVSNDLHDSVYSLIEQMNEHSRKLAVFNADIIRLSLDFKNSSPKIISTRIDPMTINLDPSKIQYHDMGITVLNSAPECNVVLCSDPPQCCAGNTLI